MSFFRDLIEQAFPVAYAAEPEEEAPADNEESNEESTEESNEEESTEEASEESEEKEDDAEEASEDGEGEDGDGDDDEDEDEDEDDDDEDEEEVVDPLDELRDECSKTAQCVPFVHHFDHCVERVQKEQEDPDYAHKEHKEDCVEEFFHLQHCINDCAAPRLFHKLK